MSVNIDILFERIYKKYDNSSATGTVAQYIYNNKEQDLASIAQQYIQNDFSQSNLSRFVNATQKTIRNLIKEENIEGLLTKSKQEIVQVAENRGIPLSSFDKRIDTKSGDDWFSASGLKLDDLDKANRIKESLRWINCLTEFYCGKALFREETQPMAITFEKLMQPSQEEDPIYQLWLQGHLQCDLER